MLSTSAPDAPGIAIWLANTPATLPPQREFAVKRENERKRVCMHDGRERERERKKHLKDNI